MFSDVYGQDHITSVLRYEVANEKTSHAYLFCGSRGTGKTTCAKLLARAVNCENPSNGEPCGVCHACKGIENGTITDVLEIDAASNNSVEDIRTIRDEVVYTPAEVKHRVYIVDEVHMLSIAAFNALLKTLEEPPQNVIFILATTELQKLPATIISRCRRFDFRRITQRIIADRLIYISQNEGIEITDDAALLIARNAQGGMRDALCLLELCAAGGAEVDTQRTLDIIGLPGRELLIRTVNAALRKDNKTIFEIVADIYNSSRDIAVFWQELISFYRDMLVVKSTPDAKEYLDLTGEEYDNTRAIAETLNNDTVISHISILDSAYISMQRNVVSKRLCAEMALIRLSGVSSGGQLSYGTQPLGSSDAVQSLYDRISALEEKVSRGSFSNDKIISEKNTEKAAEATTKTELSKTESVVDSLLSPDKKRDKILRAVDNWLEFIKKYEKQDSATAAFLRHTTAFFNDEANEIVIKSDNKFTVQMLEKRGAADALRSFFGNGAEIKFEFTEQKQNGKSPIDEIIEKANTDI